MNIMVVKKNTQKDQFLNKKGFTLVELLIVIAIIGILSSIVMVDTRSAVNKAKRTSALTSAASILPELVTCADDGYYVSTATPAASGKACCATTACAAFAPGHDIAWPDVVTKTGWTYEKKVGALDTGDYAFQLAPPSGISLAKIRCDISTSACCDVGSAGCTSL